jgi:hypothetical protein
MVVRRRSGDLFGGRPDYRIVTSKAMLNFWGDWYSTFGGGAGAGGTIMGQWMSHIVHHADDGLLVESQWIRGFHRFMPMKLKNDDGLQIRLRRFDSDLGLHS